MSSMRSSRNRGRCQPFLDGRGITNINKKKSDRGKEIWYNKRSMTYLCPADFVLCREAVARIEGLGTDME